MIPASFSGIHLTRKPYELLDEFNESLYPKFLVFLNQKYGKVPGERRAIKQSYLNNMRSFKYDPGREVNRWAQKSAAEKNRLVSHIRK